MLNKARVVTETRSPHVPRGRPRADENSCPVGENPDDHRVEWRETKMSRKWKPNEGKNVDWTKACDFADSTANRNCRICVVWI